MAVKIFIKRRLKAGFVGKASEMIIQARTNALGEKGYISSETLRSLEDPNEIVVVSMWENKSDWDRYKNSPSRVEMENKFREFTDGPTLYAMYRLGLSD